ncbi:InlB B-repeat-containing protein [Bifidobacterium adolescentis]|uniref:InlB B-repeat-containing protein n=3 Tax=Bifidobacterium adolescentis TaxID=1680 RepID=UPI0022E863C8|nr:InlB B-repeat-containing protein [Bifidobacterium adolescentis]
MGFLTRLLAGLTAAAALGTGLAGTANAVDTNGAAVTTKSVVKLTADDTNNLPDHIVNGSFDYPSVPSWTGLAGSSSNKFNKGKLFATINPGTGKYGSGCAMSTTGRAIPNWNRSSFAWSSTQGDTHYSGGMSCEAGNVELNYDSVHHNQFAELTADQQGTAIYQDVKVTPGTMMKWSLKHSSATSAYVDKMQVMIGEPYKETVQEATRIASENGNKVGEKMTTISTPTTSDRADNKKWDTYSGTYLVPDGVTTVRFTFKSVASAEWYSGNDLDDIEFSRSYKLTYDKNSSDAAGEVPSNQRGKENTVQPAESKTDGNVKTVSDDAAGRTVLECKQSGEGATGPYADKFCWIDWSNLPLSRTGEPIPVRINVPGGHIDADATITHTDNAALTTKDFTGDKWSRLIPAYRLTGNTALAFHHIQGNSADPLASVMFSNITPVANQTAASVNVLKDFQLAFGDAETMSGYVVNDRKTYEQTDIESDKTLDKLGMIGDDNPNQSYSEANIGYGTTHVTLAGGPAGKHAPFTDDSNSKGAAVIGATQPTRFEVSFKQVNHPVNNAWSAIAVGVYMPYLTAYPLIYDKNSSNATGEVPSNQRGKENTTQPAASKTNGTVKTVADDTSNLPDHLVNGDFEYPGANVLSKNRYDEKDYNWWGVSRKDKMVYDPSHETQWVSLPSTFDSDRFAWDSTEVARVQNRSSQWHTNEVELQRDSRTGNMYAELCAYQAHTSIRQYIHTTPGTLYKVRLKHASLSRDYLDKMQVLVGPAGNEQPVRMTRVESQNGLDATGESTASTTVSTHASNGMEIKDGQGTPYSSRNHNGQWATYEGVYVATSDVTSFTFKSVDAKAYNLGNLLDDIVFDKAYRLSYDKNSTAASGQVPSNERGRENTVQPAKAKTTGTVKTVADENVRYGSLANGDFSYPSFSDIQKNEQGGDADLRTFLKSDDGTLWYNMSATDLSKYGKIGQIPGFDSSRFAWSSTENGSRVELQQDRNTKNTYAEIVAQQDNTSIYQNVSTGNGGVLYKIRLKHASRQSSHADRMQVLVGSDTDHATPVEMTRVTSNGHGDKVGGKSTIITTKVSNTDPRDHGAQWETYEGYYQVPEGQKNTVFMFKSLEGFKEVETLPGNNVGNLVDDIEFSRSYKLTYDANSSDASGQVPSDTAANTVKQAKSKTNGSVRLAADDDVVEYAANGLPKQLVNSDFDHDWRNIVSQSKMTDKYNFANIDPAHGDVEISGALNGKGEASKQWVHLNGFDAAKFGWKSNQTDTRVDGRGGIVEIQRSRANDNMYAEITASQANTYLYQDIDTAHSTPTVYTVKLRYAHRNGTINSNEKIQILVGAPGHEQPVEMTRIASDRGNRLGEKSTTVNAPNTDGWLGSWDTFQGSVVVPAGQNVSRFTFKALGSIDGISGNLIDDVQFKLAYKLSYDKNAQDATGSIPSGAAANTTRPAKSETDGKVSDLVQRTTTHEDGSVTVRTIDTSTDVVSGCQVYYPAGQKITLATMAKDDDCWDASMLSRPGHTQLGWNQDRNATQAQAQVTMVEGGMTVYAVWVGNPVLTYDTNKPNTWTGQMPSTPASVSVPYNTAAADGSGWRAGDTTKIRGYRFLGWYTTPQDGSNLYDWNTPLTGSVTVYAHWQRLQANVIYNANGGTGSHPNTTGWQYSDVTIPGDTSKSFKRDKYVFKGWGTKPGKADVVYKGGSKVALQDKDITLYAQWQEVHENFVETGGIGLPIAIAGGVLLLMFGIGSTVMLTRRMNGHGMPDAE